MIKALLLISLFAQITPHQQLHLDAAIADLEEEDAKDDTKKTEKALEKGKTLKEWKGFLKEKKKEADDIKTGKVKWPDALKGKRDCKIHDYLEGD